MPETFSLSRSECSPISSPSLRSEIDRHTGNEAETSRILRSLERFGGDASIERYEVTPQKSRRFAQKGAAVTWNVRAVRSSGAGRG